VSPALSPNQCEKITLKSRIEYTGYRTTRPALRKTHERANDRRTSDSFFNTIHATYIAGLTCGTRFSLISTSYHPFMYTQLKRGRPFPEKCLKGGDIPASKIYGAHVSGFFMGKEGTIWPVCSPCGPYMGKMVWDWSTGDHGATGIGFGYLGPRWAIPRYPSSPRWVPLYLGVNGAKTIWSPHE
jgi:hypothetical protein